jgi:hypothetical protein
MGAYELGGVGDFVTPFSLGATVVESTPEYKAWSLDAVRRGGVVTNMPDIPNARVDRVVGLPAARFPSATASGRYVKASAKAPPAFYRYELANTRVVTAARVATVQQAATIAAGKVAAVGESVAQGIVDAPKNAFAAITGLPRWFFPVAIGAGLLWFVSDKLGVDTRAAGRSIARRFRANPRGRRRRLRRR